MASLAQPAWQTATPTPSWGTGCPSWWAAPAMHLASKGPASAPTPPAAAPWWRSTWRTLAFSAPRRWRGWLAASTSCSLHRWAVWAVWANVAAAAAAAAGQLPLPPLPAPSATLLLRLATAAALLLLQPAAGSLCFWLAAAGCRIRLLQLLLHVCGHHSGRAIPTTAWLACLNYLADDGAHLPFASALACGAMQDFRRLS